MSKKYKIKKKVSQSVPEKSSEINPSSKQTLAKSNQDTEVTLILFDKKTNWFLLILLVTYFTFSLLKIHSSSIANWDRLFGIQNSESIIAGKAKAIRADEWVITTPALMGQYKLGLPLKNEANGGGNAPIVFGLPIKDISTILRPVAWPYFVLDFERAFSFAWNFNIFFFLISTFLLLMLLTKNNFWLCVFASFFLLLGTGIQWWSYTIASFMIFLNGTLLSFIYLLYAKRAWVIILSSIMLIVCIFSFLAFLYPPFQIPLIYLYLSILIGFLIQKKKFSLIKDKWPIRLAAGTVSFIFLGVILFHYYLIARDTFSIMANTVYPGRRFSTGGDLIDGKLFAEFFGIFMAEEQHPLQWGNICEASGFIMFFPIIFYCIGYIFLELKKIDPLLMSISVYLIIGLIYLLAGFPAFLSKITLFSMSPSYRALPIIEAGNCILLICFIGNRQSEKVLTKLSWLEFGSLAVVVFVFFRFVSSHVNNTTNTFFTSKQITIVTFLFTVVYLLIRYKDFKFVKPALYLILTGISLPNLLVNPITKGFAPILENPLYNVSKEIDKKDPGAKWALFGDIRVTHLIKAAGVKIFNGVKYTPLLEDMKVLDPSGKKDSVYNRYSHVTMTTKIQTNDTVMFELKGPDSYTIFMDPCSPRLKVLGIKYIAFSYEPLPSEIRCMSPVIDTAGIFIFKRNDQ